MRYLPSFIETPCETLHKLPGSPERPTTAQAWQDPCELQYPNNSQWQCVGALCVHEMNPKLTPRSKEGSPSLEAPTLTPTLPAQPVGKTRHRGLVCQEQTKERATLNSTTAKGKGQTKDPEHAERKRKLTQALRTISLMRPVVLY